MVERTFRSALLCVLFLISGSSTASLFSWLTGSYTDTTPKLPMEMSRPGGRPATVPLNPYPEETGECAPWGDIAVVPHYSNVDSTSLIGSNAHVPVGSFVAVTNVKNGNTIRVRIVPPRTIPIAGRVMNLSPVAFSALANLGEGVFVCKVSVIQATSPRQSDIYPSPTSVYDNGDTRYSGPPLLSNLDTMGGLRNAYPNIY